MLRRMCLLLLLSMALCRAEIIDRVAVTVGKREVAQSDILREIRLSAFFNQAEPDFTPPARRKAAERLVERALMENEMEIGRYPAPQSTEIEAAFSTMKKDRFPTEESYRSAVAKYGISEEDVKLYLLLQAAVLRFIDARFGPGVQIAESEMRGYYASRFVPGWQDRDGKPAPAFEEVRREIEQNLRAERADRLVDDWLKEAKARIRIEFKEEAFQ
jgi:hypothetical protein